MPVEAFGLIVSRQQPQSFQDLAVYKKNDIVPFQPPEGRFGLFHRAPKLKFPDGEKLRDEVFLLAQVHVSPGTLMLSKHYDMVQL